MPIGAKANGGTRIEIKMLLVRELLVMSIDRITAF